jgi:hypothetical protein
MPCLLWRQHLGVDHLLDARVIASEELQLVVAKQVGAAVADVCDVRAPLRQQHDQRGRTHVLGVRVATVREAMDFAIGF